MLNYKLSIILIYNNAKETLDKCLESIFGHSFKNFELICVDNGSDDGGSVIVHRYQSEYPSVKMLSIPVKQSDLQAKIIALGVASGEFVYFADAKTELTVDFSSEMYSDNFKLQQIQNNRVYKKSFFEDYNDIVSLIDDKISARYNILNSFVEDFFKKFDIEYQNFRVQTAENIQGKVYNVYSRIEQSEKNTEEKYQMFQTLLNNAVYEQSSKNDCDISKVYNSITDVYSYINVEIRKKCDELSRIYDEISKNYKYTENIVDKKFDDLNYLIENSKYCFDEKIRELEEKFKLRYLNLKRLLEMKAEELLLQSVNSVDFSSGVQNGFPYESLEKLNDLITSSTQDLYKEISDLSQNLNKKINYISELQEKKINDAISVLRDEIKSEIVKNITELKREL